MTIGAFGPQVAFTLTAEFGDGERGALGGLVPARSGVPDLQALVPEGTATWLGWQIDPAAGYATWVRALAGLTSEDPKATAAKLQQRYGCDVPADVLPLLGTEALLLWPEAAAAAAAEADMPSNEFCLVVPVRDEPALRTIAGRLATRLRGVEATDDGGAFVCNWPTFGRVRIADGVLCLFGDAVAPDFCDRLSANVARWRRGKALDRGAGIIGVGRVDIARFAVHELYADLLVLRLWFMARVGNGSDLPPVAVVAEELGRWLPMLRQHQLGDASVELRTWPAKSQLRVSW